MDHFEVRRSDRVTTSIRLLVSGNNGAGSFFMEETTTVAVSLRGARIVLKQMVAPSTDVLVRNIATGAEADMQIIGKLADGPGGYHYALRLLVDINIWGIDFPPLADADVAAGRVLLACQVCHSSAVVYLDEFELEVFERDRAITFPCKTCGAPTSWILPNQETAAPLQSAAQVNQPAPSTEPLKTEGGERRRDKRLPLRMKACVRTDRFGDEEVFSENISKGGFSFQSSQRYEVGSILEVSLPFSRGAGNIFSPAKIARFLPVSLDGSCTYGVCYVREVKDRPQPLGSKAA